MTTKLDRLWELEKKATEGYWQVQPQVHGGFDITSRANGMIFAVAYEPFDEGVGAFRAEHDAAFIASLRNAAPHLLAIARFYSSERDNDEWPTMAMAAHDAFEALLEPVE